MNHIAIDPRPGRTAAFAAGRRLAGLQSEQGHWEAEVLWSPVITAQAVIVHAITRRLPDAATTQRMLHYFRTTVRPEGGWGLHPESRAYVFVTTLVYVAMRLLGAQSTEPVLIDARRFLASQTGGVLANPQWGRFWLAILGLYPWRELNACPPELFLLPRSSPLSPLRFYCHTRYIYLAMAYLSGVRFDAKLGSIIEDLRAELPGLAGSAGKLHHHPVAGSDLHEAPGTILRLSYGVARAVGRVRSALPRGEALRARALAVCLGRIRYEQRVTSYQSLSPVSGLLNTLALWSADPNDPDVAASLEGLEFWCWDDETDGRRYAGARSVSWDTSFALQALARAARTEATRYADVIRKGYASLCAMQATRELPDRIAQDRDINLGGWCFTEGQQAWPVSDCTAEAVLAILDCEAIDGLIPVSDRIDRARLASAADFILSRQNSDGGFGSYEQRRGSTFLEHLNPSEMFGRCMTELSYVECTASSIRALHRLLQTDAPLDAAKLQTAIRRGTELILARQNADGSWPGFWGINVIYGTLFALEGLRTVGIGTDHPAFRKARVWIEERQKPDGGWGEHFEGCATGRYVEHPRSLVISTAWATLALLAATDNPPPAAHRGADWLRRHQQADGDWPRDSVNGVFFGTAMLDYRLYNTYFPLMALSQLDQHVVD